MNASIPAKANGYALAPASVVTHTRAGRIEHADSGGSGPVLLTLHGGMGGYDQSWLLARSLLSNLDAFRVIAVSRPGYLGTPQTVGRTPEQQADALVALLDALKIQQTFIAAVSAGGPAGLAFALRYPERCRGLILASAVTGPFAVPDRIIARLRFLRLVALVPGLAALLQRRTDKDPSAAARRSIADPALVERTLAHPEAGPLFRALQAGITYRLAERVGGTVNDIKAYRSMADFEFDGIRVPMLVIHGTSDRIVPFSHARAVADHAPNVQLHSIDGGEHVVLFTHLDEVRKTTKQFFQQHDKMQ